MKGTSNKTINEHNDIAHKGKEMKMLPSGICTGFPTGFWHSGQHFDGGSLKLLYKFDNILHYSIRHITCMYVKLKNQ